MARELNIEGITLAEFQNDPLLRQRLKEFRHHFGQPPEVRARLHGGDGDRLSGQCCILRCPREAPAPV